jgi:hypothetical protein
MEGGTQGALVPETTSRPLIRAAHDINKDGRPGHPWRLACRRRNSPIRGCGGPQPWTDAARGSPRRQSFWDRLDEMSSQ